MAIGGPIRARRHREVRSVGEPAEGVGGSSAIFRDAMDTPLKRPPLLRRYAPYAVGVIVAMGGAVWLLHGVSISTYRVPVDQVTIGKVTRGRFEDYIAVRGRVAPLTTNYLTTEQGGIVKKVLTEDGATVKAGQPVIELSNAALRMQVAAREASTASQIDAIENTKLQLEQTRFRYQRDLLDIEHQIAQLRSNLARDKILLDGKALAPSLYAQEQQQYRYELKLRAATVASRNAQGRVRAAQLAQLGKTLGWLKDDIATAKASLDDLTIRAPISGQLTALDAKVGESKPAGTVLGQVDSLDRFKLTAEIDEFYIGRVALGQRARFKIGGHQFWAQVVRIHPNVSDGTFKVDLHFIGAAPRGLQVGQAIDMRLELGGASKALLLPNGPFYQDTGGNWAFVIAPDGHYALHRNIELGRRNPDAVEVLRGLEPGERVVISSYQGFKDIERLELEKPSHAN